MRDENSITEYHLGDNRLRSGRDDEGLNSENDKIKKRELSLGVSAEFSC